MFLIINFHLKVYIWQTNVPRNLIYDTTTCFSNLAATAAVWSHVEQSILTKTEHIFQVFKFSKLFEYTKQILWKLLLILGILILIFVEVKPLSTCHLVTIALFISSGVHHIMYKQHSEPQDMTKYLFSIIITFLKNYPVLMEI